MNLDKYFSNKDELPLDNLIENGGGMCSIFRTIGCIGDSLSSGEFQCKSEEGIYSFLDFYEYSWGQFMARATGSKVYNFSQGGMTAKAFMSSFGVQCGAFDFDHLCQAYIIALGVNDINKEPDNLGTIEDIGAKNMTFTAQYSAIIETIKRKQQKAKFFLMTLPRRKTLPEETAREDKHAELIYAMAEKYKNCYVLDFRKYAPVYDEKFRESFYLSGHMNPMGYLLTSQMVVSYIDWIIRHNMQDFKQVGLIGTPYYTVEE